MPGGGALLACWCCRRVLSTLCGLFSDQVHLSYTKQQLRFYALSLQYIRDTLRQQKSCGSHKFFFFVPLLWYSLSLVCERCIEEVSTGVQHPMIYVLISCGFLWWSLSATQRSFSDEGWELHLCKGVRITTENAVRDDFGWGNWQLLVLL